MDKSKINIEVEWCKKYKCAACGFYFNHPDEMYKCLDCGLKFHKGCYNTNHCNDELTKLRDENKKYESDILSLFQNIAMKITEIELLKEEVKKEKNSSQKQILRLINQAWFIRRDQERAERILSKVTDEMTPLINNLSIKIENLKCCGNCRYYEYDMEEDHYYCNKHIYNGKRHAGICSTNWQSDGLTRKERV